MKKAPDSTRSTTADAVLGMLSLTPMSGYQMRQMIEGTIGNFWTESYGQIYPTLKKLVSEGLVKVKTEDRRGKPSRNIYSLSKAGRERLQDWLQIPAQTQVPRNELLLKLFFSELTSAATAIAQVESFRALQKQRLNQYAALVEHTTHRYGDNPGLPYWIATIRYGQAMAQALTAWSEETVETLQKLSRKRDLRLVKSARPV